MVLKRTHLHLNDIPSFQIFWSWMKMSGLYSGQKRVLRSVPGARFWAGTASKRLQLFYLRVCFKAAVSGTLPIFRLAESLDWQMLFHSVSTFWTLWAPGMLWGPLLPRASLGHIQLPMMTGTQAGRHHRYCHLQKSRVTEEPGTGRVRQDQTLKHSGSQAKLSPAQLHGAQRTTLATYRLVCGESHLHGKSWSYSYLSDAERWVLRIIGEFQPSRLNQTWACTLHFTDITDVWQKGKGFFPLAGYEVDFIWLACLQMLSLLLTSCVTVNKLLCFSVPQLPSL